jgi:hypothetical protein
MPKLKLGKIAFNLMLNFLGRNYRSFLMRKKFLILIFLVVWIIVTCLTLLVGFTYNWSDNVHVDYGLPLTWGTNTLSTFVGPVDNWSVNILNLFVDLLCWLGIMTTIVAGLLYNLKD